MQEQIGMTMQRWMIEIEYHGAPFCGWQRQDNCHIPSVQGELQRALSLIYGTDIDLQGAGRTDTGVHARGQIAHFDEEYSEQLKFKPFELIKAINNNVAGLPIAVKRAEKVDPDFHARFSAKRKLYRYTILQQIYPPVFELDRVWHLKGSKALDVQAMRNAAQYFVGQHDFSAFRASLCQAKNPVRGIDQIEIIETPSGSDLPKRYEIEVEAQSFLHHMVRNIAGTLKYVGDGKIKPEDIPALIEGRDRTKTGPTAPAQGLELVRIMYD